MRLKPGCGCAVLVLALANLIGFLFFALAAVVGEDITGATIAMSVLLGLVLLADAGVCVMVGWTSVRAGGLKLPSLLEGEEE